MELLNLRLTDLKRSAKYSSAGNVFKYDMFKEARDIKLVEAVVRRMFWLVYVM